jgi:hypothetical protein
MERCMRCGEEGEDRRTLWMACFYEMKELGIPFMEQFLILAKTKDLDLAICKGELTPQPIYTLRVCKACRAGWMAAISAWFKERPTQIGCGSGIFVRRNGVNVEISQEEWDRLHS